MHSAKTQDVTVRKYYSLLSIVHVQTVEYKYALRATLQPGSSKVGVTVMEINEHLMFIGLCIIAIVDE